MSDPKDTEILKIRSGNCAEGPPNPALTFPYEPDTFQKHAFWAIDEGDHLLVTAHTGSGKTTVAEYAVAHAIRQNKKIIYTTPIKALSNQIYKDFREKYPSWDVGIRTGDIDMNSDAQVLIMTTEILRNILYNAGTEKPEIVTDEGSGQGNGLSIENVAVVIFDEVHYIKDYDRGTVWEESIILMPKEVQMVMLSATLPDAEKFGKWIGLTKGIRTSYVTTSQRVVPLTHYVFTPGKLVKIMDNIGKFDNTAFINASKDYTFRSHKLNEYIMNLREWNLLPAFFFCFSRNNCEKFAKCITVNLVESKTSTKIVNLFDKKLAVFGDRFKGLEQVTQLRNLLSKGVGYHHSGLPPVLKEIVEILFSEGLIHILFVTETFAAGVNMPTKTVIFTGLDKYDGFHQGFRSLHPEEYLQMAGRAGRRGKDKKGTVILLPFRDFPTLNEIRGIMCGVLSPINSRFNMNYKFLIRVLTTDNLDVLSFSDKTLMKTEMNKYDRELEDKIKGLEETRKQNRHTWEFSEDNLSLGIRRQHARLVKKEQRQYQRFLKSLSDEQKEKYSAEVTEYNESCILDRELEQHKLDLKNSRNYVKSHTWGLLSFLHGNGYIDELYDSPLDYGSKNLTVKGLLANEVNECNEILLTELICSDKLEGLTFPELVSTFSLFLEEKDTDRWTDIKPKVQDVATYLRQLIIDLNRNEKDHNDQFTEWSISTEFTDLSYTWADGGTIGQVLQQNPDIHLGNFVRAMLKLKSICAEVVKICAISQNDQLAKVLEGYEGKMVRDIVIPDSLYVR